jgi:hypothetical protein
LTVVPQPEALTTIASSPPVSRRLLLPEMVGQRAATQAPLGNHHLAAMSGKQPDRCFVDLRRDHPLRAAGQQRDAAAALANRGEDLRPVDRRGSWQPRRGEVEHRAQPLRQQRGERLGDGGGP